MIKIDSNFNIKLSTSLDENSLLALEKKLANEKVKMSVDLDITNFAKSENEIKKQIESLAKGLQTSLKNINVDVSNKDSLKYAKDYYGQLVKTAKKQRELADVMANGRESSSFKRSIDDEKKRASAIESERKSEEKLANTIGKRREQTELLRKEEEKRANVKQSSAMNKALEDEQKLLQKIRNEVNSGKIDTQVSTVASKYNKLAQVTDVLKTDFSELKLAQEALANSNSSEEMKNNYDKLITQIQKVKTEIADINSKDLVSDVDKNAAITRFKNYMFDNSNITKEAKNQLREFIATIQSSDNLTKGDLKNLNMEFSQLDSNMKSLNRKGLSLGDSVKAQAAKFTQWISVSGLIMSGVNELRNMVSNIKKLDDAMVDLKKTTDATSSQLATFYDTADVTAKKLGVTTQEIIEQTSAWSRLGYSIKDAATMAEDSSIFKSISPGMDIDMATDGLVSTMKAFKVDANDALDGIISKINIIGNTQAVDNQDIVDILTRSSSAMAEANNTLEQTIALGTAGTEITRDASNMGQVLKTVSMRIRGYDEEAEEYTDDLANLSGEIADFTKTASTPGGISIFTDEDKQTYKSTYEIFKEISQIYDELSDKNQANILCLYV